jgi:flavorubredoxin
MNKRRAYAQSFREEKIMTHIMTLIAENIFVIIGFASYGALVYYMVAKVISRYSGKKSANHTGTVADGSCGSGNKKGSVATSLDRYFLVFFDHDAEKALRQTESRRDFSKNITTANSYIHRISD